MVEKLRLKDGTELDLIPMGITDNGKLRYFKFRTDLIYEDILARFTNEVNLERVEYILADGSIGTTYEDCTVFKSLTFIPNVQIDDNTVSDIYVVAICTDAVERDMQSINKKLTNIVDTIIMMSMPIM